MSEARTADATLAADTLAGLASPEVQRLAARMAQDAYTRIFRLSLEGDEAELAGAVTEIGERAGNWVRAAPDEGARALRLALLVGGIDQWNLAHARAFGFAALPGISVLVSGLLGAPEAHDDARFQQQCAAIEAAESDAIDFKMELRRNIHLALWHAMIACEDDDEARPILAALAGMMTGLVGRMPTLGWRLLADTLAHIQLRCLSDPNASQGLAAELTQELFNALRGELPREVFETMLAHASQAVIAAQRARRAH